MSIKIISVGKIKEKYLLSGINEYLKRLSKYTKIETIELKDEKAPENLSDKDIQKVKDIEGERILEKIKNEYVIVLAIEGEMIDSLSLAKKLIEIQTYHHSDISFIIGGSLGLSRDVIKRSNYQLSFSRLTFPHQLMKLILLEQIYRAFRINHNEPYHK